MGWGHCGTDSGGREIGYCIAATCDYPGCEAKIDRGLSYACGGMHGPDDCRGIGGVACEGYFCPVHLIFAEAGGECLQLCPACASLIPDSEAA